MDGIELAPSEVASFHDLEPYAAQSIAHGRGRRGAPRKGGHARVAPVEMTSAMRSCSDLAMFMQQHAKARPARHSHQMSAHH